MNKTNKKQRYTEWITELIDEALTIDEIVKTLYDDESMFNNCDKTTRQRIYTAREIKKLVNNVIDELIQDDERCSTCGIIYDDENYILDYNSLPDGHIESIPIGYKCPYCGEKEFF